VKSNFLYGDYLLEVLQVESQTGLIERPDLAYPPIDLTVDLDVSLNKVAEICYIMFELDPFLLNSILLADLED
jgi:hypothetical protein